MVVGLSWISFAVLSSELPSRLYSLRHHLNAEEVTLLHDEAPLDEGLGQGAGSMRCRGYFPFGPGVLRRVAQGVTEKEATSAFSVSAVR